MRVDSSRLGYNIIGNNADAVISSQPTDQIGTPAAPIDPLLGPLANNGGPTLTRALQSGSPAIDHGDPAAPPQDQRGYSRMGVPDVGAFEFGGVATTLGNISTRAFVQTGDNVMIGGFIVQGTEPKRVIIRAIGPELTQYGVPNALANPTLELHNRTGALIASNDNWRTTDHRRDHHQRPSPGHIKKRPRSAATEGSLQSSQTCRPVTTPRSCAV